MKQESCAIATMTARCALYKWIEWAVAEMWPFEIIQDVGQDGRQLGIDVTGNSVIRSADPENPTLEPNMKCIRSPVAERRYGHSRILGAYEPPFLGKGRS